MLAAANRHLTVTDGPLLAVYVQAVTRTHRLGRGKDVGGWEKSARLAMALARSLRLTPQSTTDPQTIGRRRKDDPPPQLWAQELEDDE